MKSPTGVVSLRLSIKLLVGAIGICSCAVIFAAQNGPMLPENIPMPNMTRAALAPQNEPVVILTSAPKPAQIKSKAVIQPLSKPTPQVSVQNNPRVSVKPIAENELVDQFQLSQVPKAVHHQLKKQIATKRPMIKATVKPAVKLVAKTTPQPSVKTQLISAKKITQFKAVAYVKKPSLIHHQSVSGVLQPGFISKKAAIKLLNKKRYQVRIAYNLKAKGYKVLWRVPKIYSFYFNPFTKLIAVAKDNNTAIALSYPKPKVYFAVKNQTLSQTVQRWAKTAGYMIEWQSSHDYVLQVSHTFLGDLLSSNGVLSKTLAAFQNSQYPLKAVVASNDVILIQDIKSGREG